MWPSALRLILAGACLSLVVSGCSEDDPEPRLSPGGSSSSAPAPSPSGPVEPTLPPEAEGEDAAAAEAFVRHYWAMVNYAQDTGDVSGLRGASAASCASCQSVADFIERTYAAGGGVVGGTYTVRSVTSKPIYASDDVLFRARMKVANTSQVVSEPGKDDVEFPASEVSVEFVVNRVSDSWRVGIWDVQT